MDKLKCAFLLFLLLPLFLFSQANIINISDFGARGDGIHDDYPAIQKALNSGRIIAGSTVKFDSKKVYKISKPLNVYSNIDGNGSRILPTSTLALKIRSSHIKLSNVIISSETFKFLRLDKSNITIDNCDFETKSYFSLLAIEGDNITISNSRIKNKYTKNDGSNKGRFYAITSRTGINNLTLNNNIIFGGVYIETDKPKKAGNFLIKNNEITVDFTNAPQNFNTLHDAVVLIGISDILFEHNYFNFINVCRGFNITDLYTKKNNQIVISEHPPTNIRFNYNVIKSTAVNGKQLFGLFAGTKSIRIKNNKIYSKGHTSIFENKTTTDKENRIFILENNDVHFDNEILYMNGNINLPKLDNSVVIKNNNFYYDDTSFKFSTERKGQDNAIKFNYVINVRNISQFEYGNNKLIESNAKLQFKGRYFFYLQNVLESNITNSTYKGAIKFEPLRKHSIITLKQNNILESGFDKKIITDPKNLVKYNIVTEN